MERWSVSRSDNSRKGSKAYPRRGRGYTWFRRSRVKRARRAASTDLAKGSEPVPDRHRHGALRDWF